MARELSIRRVIIYLHLANIRKRIGAQNSIEMLHMIRSATAATSHGLKFTPRGKEVFRLILEGNSDKQIGIRLGISYSGVRRHKEKMLLLNGCGTILELVAKYYENCTLEVNKPPGA